MTVMWKGFPSFIFSLIAEKSSFVMASVRFFPFKLSLETYIKFPSLSITEVKRLGKRESSCFKASKEAKSNSMVITPLKSLSAIMGSQMEITVLLGSSSKV